MGLIILISICLIVSISAIVIDLDYRIETVIITIVIMVAVATMILGDYAMGYYTSIQEYEVEQYKIYGVEDNWEIAGRFTLGTGSIRERMKYYYFTENAIGKYIESITATGNVYIRETDDVEPCLIYRYQVTEFKYDFLKWFFGDKKTTTLVAKILVVPTNTIKVEYNVDLVK